MRGLMSADWYRARKGGIVLIASLIVTAMIVVLVLDIPNLMMFDHMSSTIPGTYLTLSGFIGAIVCGISAERDFREGGIRNKIVTGATRSKTYWSAYIVNTLITFVAAMVYVAVTLAVGSQIGFTDAAALQENFLQGLSGVAAFTAMYSMIGVMWPYKYTTLLLLIILIVLMAVSSSILMSLMEPETYTPMQYIFVDGVGDIPVNADADPIPNPNYVAEPARSVYSFFNSFLPTGQAVQIQGNQRMGFLPPYAAGFCAVCFAVSLTVIKRRNLQ